MEDYSEHGISVRASEFLGLLKVIAYQVGCYSTGKSVMELRGNSLLRILA